MTEPVEIDPKVRWEIHDDRVRERRRSGWRFLGIGFVLFLCGFLWPIFGLFGFIGLIGLIAILIGLWNLVRAGRLSADVIREVEARRRT